MNVVILLLGLVLVTFGADLMVNGSVAVAKRYRMPEFLIGLTIVGIGTSMPELVVSFIAGLEGKGAIAVGNVVGSNLANTLLILGTAALIRPISISPTAIKVDIPYNIFATVVLFLMCFGLNFRSAPQAGILSRFDGIVLLLLFVIYMAYSFRTTPKTAIPSDNGDQKPPMPLWKAALCIAGGLAALIIGGRWFVNGASSVAASLGISEAIIAITVVAIGTSLPELATSVVAAMKGNTQLALGNIIGSNIFNICLILGISATVKPVNAAGILPLDVIAPLAAAVLLWLAVYTFKGRRVNRVDGVVFLAVYIAYVVYLAMR